MQRAYPVYETEHGKVSYISPTSSAASSSSLHLESSTERNANSAMHRRDMRRNYKGISPSHTRSKHSASTAVSHRTMLPSESIYLEIEKQRHEGRTSKVEGTQKVARDHLPRASPNRGTVSSRVAGSTASPRKANGYRGPFDSEVAAERGYQSPAYDYQTHSGTAAETSQPIMFRDADTSSVMTGLSQQELIRKKAREDSAKRKQRKFAKPSRKKQTIVQLPANLFAATAPLMASPPLSHFALTDSTSSSPVGKDKLLRQRWNIVKNLGSKSSEEEESTAETTNASAEVLSQQQQQKQKQPPQAQQPQQPQQRGSPKKIPQHPAVSVRGDDALLVENSSLDNRSSSGEFSFPLLSKNAASGNNLLGDERRCINEVAREAVESSQARRGVRFAGTIARTSTQDAQDDESSSVPWDEHSSLGKQERSPKSVLESNIQQRDTIRPKSILRTSRFKASPGIVRYYDRRGLPPRPGGVHLSTGVGEHFLSEDDLDAEPRAVVEYKGEVPVPGQDSVSKRLDPFLEAAKPEPSQGGRVNFSLEVSPPRKGTGFFDSDTKLELSPIRSEDIMEKRPAAMAPASHQMGHPAEKHLRQKMDSFLGMRKGEIADRVIGEEQYPDPPVELNMDDDDTVLSAYAFIETVAAIVVQTAVRRFLAMRHVADTLHAHSLQHETEREYHSEDQQEVRRALPELERFEKGEESDADSVSEWREESSSEGGSEGFQQRPLLDDSDAEELSSKSMELSEQLSHPQEVKDVQSNEEKFGHKEESTEMDRSSDETTSSVYDLAAVLIQSVFRGFWVRDCLDIDHYCATAIEKSFRGFCCRNDYRKALNKIILVQSWCRRNIARDEAANLLAYVIFLQAVFRGHRVRVFMKKYRARKARSARRRAEAAAATIIQAVFRGHRIRRLMKKYHARKARIAIRKVEAAAILIQTRWRAFICEAIFIRTLVDVLIVQTIVRRWLAQKRTALVRRQSQASRRLRSRSPHRRRSLSGKRENAGVKRATSNSDSKQGKPIAAEVHTLKKQGSRRRPSASKSADVKEADRRKADVSRKKTPPASKNSKRSVAPSASKVVAYPMAEDLESTLQCEGENHLSSRSPDERGLNESSSPVSDPPGIVSRTSRARAKKPREAKAKARKHASRPTNSNETRKDAETIRTRRRIEEMAHSPSGDPCTYEEEVQVSSRTAEFSKGNTSNLLSMWKEKEKKNARFNG